MRNKTRMKLLFICITQINRIHAYTKTAYIIHTYRQILPDPTYIPIYLFLQTIHAHTEASSEIFNLIGNVLALIKLIPLAYKL